MKKAVYLTIGVYPGGKTRAADEVRAQQNLAALRALGYDITVITPRDEHGRNGIDLPTVWLDPIPSLVIAEYLRHYDYRKKVQAEVARHLDGPDTLLFCEHFYALASCPPHPRVVYSCLDLMVQLIRLRGQLRARPVTFKTKLYWQYLNWVEWRVVRRAQRVLCVSASEAKLIANKTRLQTGYVPIVSPDNVEPLPAAVFSPNSRFWFYGSSGATANKIMLAHLRDKLLPAIKAILPAAEFHQVGSYDTHAADAIIWMKNNFNVHGFAADPAKLFQRGDFCLIPYEYDTGFRTKLPELCGYGMIAAGYPATFACCPEMRDGYNCVIAESPQSLADKLARLAADAPARERLAIGAIETRRKNFSFDVLLEKYRQLLG